jgi:mono/diheme cytochrome c family protein
MARVSGHFGKLGFGALALAVAALPLAGAWASAEGASAAPLTSEEVEKGRQIFNDNSCNQCHVLADADARGSIGPSLDGDANLSHDFVVDRVTNGAGAMPSFGWLDAADIDLLARYIVQTKK